MVPESEHIANTERLSTDALPPFLDVATVARLFGIGPEAVRERRRKGQLVGSRPAGQRAWLFDRDYILGLLPSPTLPTDGTPSFETP